MIKCEITLDEDKTTKLHGVSIDEILTKIVEYHTMTTFEREYFTKKGHGRLDRELASGWYVGESK